MARRPRTREAAPPPAWSPSSKQAVACLIAACLLFGGSELFTYSRTSATWDEPGHLLAGYAALTRGDYRVDIEHPPLLRMWAALPLLAMTVNGSALDEVDRTRPDVLAFQGPFALGHRFLYTDNDADRLLYRARFMTVLIGVLLLVLVFGWAREWLGPRGAVLAVLLCATEPNIAAHATLVTTDLGVTCFIFGTVYFLWRTSQSRSAINVGALTLFFALAILSKFSAIVLVPVVGWLLLWLVVRRQWRLGAAAGLLALMLVATFAAAWAVYGFHAAPSRTPGWAFSLHTHPAAVGSVPVTAAIVGRLEALHVMPSALLQGFLHGQALATGRPAFLMGDFSVKGWWYYFPVAFLLKTSLTVLLLVSWGFLSRRTPPPANGRVRPFLLVPIVVYMAIAMISALNIGLRHILPIYPFVILLAAAGADALIERFRRRAPLAAAAVVTAATIELATAYPHTLAFFNAFAGGPRNGFRYLADSNVDWGQDLKGLAAWMHSKGVTKINLGYFGTADPAYYGINARHIWGTTLPTPGLDIGPPELPGYVALSVTMLDGVPFQEGARDFYRQLRESEPAADIGGSIRVYWVRSPWW